LNSGVICKEDNEVFSRDGSRMKIALFGASGATGMLLTARCLAAGYEVTALVRRPEAFAYAGQVRVVEGNAFDAGAVRRTVEGADVVLSALGARSLRREEVLERAVPLIVDAMQHSGVRRIIALGSTGAKDDSLKKQAAWRRWFMQKMVYNTLLKWAVASQASQWKTLAASGLDWTMVMPPMLTNGAGHGTYRVDGEALPRNAWRIAREDVADFMMRQIGSAEWAGRGVYIAW
jgi:putative NADH-flavin reductase